MSWAVLFGVFATLGLDQFVVRQVAVYREHDDWSHVIGLVRAANKAAFIASITLVVAAALVARAVAPDANGDLLATFLVGLLMLPLLALMKVRQAALIGLHKVVAGQWPELLLHPLVLIALLAGASLAGAASPVAAMAMTVASSLLVLALGAWMLRTSLPEHARLVASVPIALPWRSSLIPLMAMAMVQIVQSQADTLLLGALADTRAVGIYSVAMRGSQFVNFFLMAAAPAISPAIARLYAIGDTAGLERLVVTTARTTLLLSTPAAVVLIFFGRWYLWLFGEGFGEGATALAILAVGQIINVAAGPVGIVMMMTGHETNAARFVALAALANILLSVTLIPLAGLNGAAVGSATSLILWNLLMAIYVRKRLGVRCTCLG